MPIWAPPKRALSTRDCLWAACSPLGDTLGEGEICGACRAPCPHRSGKSRWGAANEQTTGRHAALELEGALSGGQLAKAARGWR